MEPTRHKSLYLDACLRDLDEQHASVVKYTAQLDQHIQSMDREIRTHLWVTPDFSAPAAQSLQNTRRDVETLLTRIDKVRKGFWLLPREVEAGQGAAATPSPLPSSAA
jgi:MoxR-like ATPase